jgi:hypothetical protein
MIALKHGIRSVIEHEGCGAHIVCLQQVGISPNSSYQVWVEAFSISMKVDLVAEFLTNHALRKRMPENTKKKMLVLVSVGKEWTIMRQVFFEVFTQVRWEGYLKDIHAPTSLTDFQLLTLKSDMPGTIAVLEEILSDFHLTDIADTHGDTNEQPDNQCGSVAGGAVQPWPFGVGSMATYRVTPLCQQAETDLFQLPEADAVDGVLFIVHGFWLWQLFLQSYQGIPFRALCFASQGNQQRHGAIRGIADSRGVDAFRMPVDKLHHACYFKQLVPGRQWRIVNREPKADIFSAAVGSYRAWRAVW